MDRLPRSYPLGAADHVSFGARQMAPSVGGKVDPEPGSRPRPDWRRVFALLLWDSVVTAAKGAALLALLGLLLPWRLAPLPACILAAFIAYYLVLRTQWGLDRAPCLASLGIWCSAILTALLDAGLQSLACRMQSWLMSATSRVSACIDCNPDHRGYVSATSIYVLLLLTFVFWIEMCHRSWRMRRQLRGQAKQGQSSDDR